MAFLMAWLWFVDTSKHTDYMLVLGITCVEAVLALYVAVMTGMGLAATGLIVLLGILVAATWYARVTWKQDEARKAAGPAKAVRIRPSW